MNHSMMNHVTMTMTHAHEARHGGLTTRMVDIRINSGILQEQIALSVSIQLQSPEILTTQMQYR